MNIMPKQIFEHIVDLFQNEVLENEFSKEDLLQNFKIKGGADVIYKGNNLVVEYHNTPDADYFTIITLSSNQDIDTEWLLKANMINAIVEYVNMKIL
jgi:hypothetical protein